MENLEVKNIITVGASAGGLFAVSKLLSSLPKDLDAALFIVIHLSKNTITQNVVDLLNREAKILVEIPKNGTKIKRGKAYLAPVNKHMMLSKGHIVIGMGPVENHWRPSIDVLFRTAAAEYDSCVTGIILTGLLDDGTSGMMAIKTGGGTCIVQEPEEAEFPDMPLSVIKNIDVDYQVPILEMGYILADLYSRETCHISKVPDQLKLESAITSKLASSYDKSELNALEDFSCPDCGKMLKTKEQKINQCTCAAKNEFSASMLENEAADKLEETLWVAIRMMEERRNFLSSLEKKSSDSRLLNEDRDIRTSELKVHIDRLKNMLQSVEKTKKVE